MCSQKCDKIQAAALKKIPGEVGFHFAGHFSLARPAMEFLSGHKPPQRQSSVRVLITETHFIHARLPRPLVCVSRRRLHIWGAAAAAAPLRLMELSSRSLSLYRGCAFSVVDQRRALTHPPPFCVAEQAALLLLRPISPQVYIQKRRGREIFSGRLRFVPGRPRLLIVHVCARSRKF